MPIEYTPRALLPSMNMTMKTSMREFKYITAFASEICHPYRSCSGISCALSSPDALCAYGKRRNQGTPAIDTVLRWAQRGLQKRYVHAGVLDLKGVAGLPVPQNYGIAALHDLIAWYRPMRAITGTAEMEKAVS
jgi:hypothetical protein